MPEEEGIVGKHASMRRVEPNKEAHFFPQFPVMRKLPNVNYCQKINIIR